MGYDAVVDSAKLNGALTATADAIRRKTDSADPITFDMDEGFKSSVDGIASGGVDTSADTVTTTTLVKDYTAHDAEGKQIVGELDVDAVRDEGYTEGHADGYAEGHEVGEAEGYEAGKKAEYDAFWDALQNSGEKKRYGTEFQSPLWTNENFRPKYDVYPGTSTFSQGGDPPKAHCNIEDMRKSTLGVNIDWTLCNNFNYILQEVPVKYIGVIDMTNAKNGWTVLYRLYTLISVEKMILPPQSANIKFSTHGFCALYALTEIRFEGYFWGSVELKDSPLLSHDSIVSAISALAPDITGSVLTLNIKAVNKAFETSEGANDGSTSEEWLTLVAAHTNWTISLAGRNS
jgi:hypothetical protein